MILPDRVVSLTRSAYLQTARHLSEGENAPGNEARSIVVPSLSRSDFENLSVMFRRYCRR